MDPRSFRVRRRVAIRSFVAAFLFASLVGRTSAAHVDGIDSTQFPDNIGCLNCHFGGTTPEVGLSASATGLAPGQSVTLTFTVTTPNATPPAHPGGAAGFNLRTDKPGTFAIGGPSATSTRILIGRSGQSEATHSSPKEGEPATFTVIWTPSPETSGDVTFIAWGNAVNENGSPEGDSAATTSLVVSVCATPALWYRDADGDGYGNAAETTRSCTQPAGYVSNGTDCNDADPTVLPGAPEICANMKDDNCDGVVDTDAPDDSVFYKDADGDGYGSASNGTAMACSPPQGYVSNNADCDDGDGAIHPGAPEVCNGRDDNCVGGADEGLGTITCGEGPCQRTVDACVGGTLRSCTPSCPDAGAAGATGDPTAVDAAVSSAPSPVATGDAAPPCSGQNGDDDPPGVWGCRLATPAHGGAGSAYIALALALVALARRSRTR
jgi:hypothetical protein